MAASIDILAPVCDDSSRTVSDSHLLERFVVQHDQGAFASLVRRYGGAVWGVCQRVLRREEDAEDAFQAVFLVLARKAASIRKSEAVGSWLYGVAYRTSMRARHHIARRQESEKQAHIPLQEQPPWSAAACRELQRILDDEVQRLAVKYREPFVLCCLEGLSKAEAARELGWKEGTVSSRLAQARELLQHRLTRRGITLSAVLTGVALSQNTAAAAVPALVVQATVQATLGATAASPSAVALAKGVLQAMALSKLKAGAAVLLTMAVLVSGTTVASFLAEDNPAKQAPQPEIKLKDEPIAFLPRPEPFFANIDDRIMTLAFSPDGRRLVTAGALPPRAGQLKIWDIAAERELVTLQGKPGIRSVAISPSGDTIATGDFRGTVRLRDAQTGKERLAAQGHQNGVNGIAFSHDAKTLVSAGLDNVVKLWDARDLKTLNVFRGHTDAILSVAFFGHGRSFVTAGRDRTVRVWDVKTGKTTLLLNGHTAAIESVAVSPDDKVIATASWDGTIKLWNAATGEETATFKEKIAAYCVAFSPDNKQLASGDASGGVSLWNLQEKKAVLLGKHRAICWAVAFSRDGKTLASGSSDRSAKLWNVETRKVVATLDASAGEHYPIEALAYAPDGKAVAVATNDHVVRVYDANTRAVLLQLRDHTRSVLSLAFSPDGTKLASGSLDRTVKLWDRSTGKLVHTLKGHTGSVLALAFSADGKTLASGGVVATIHLWDTTTGKDLGTLKKHWSTVRGLAFAPRGRTLFSCGDDRMIIMWNLDTPEKPIVLKEQTGKVYALACSPDGRTLASAGANRVVKLWDLPGGTERRSLSGDAGDILTLAFSPGGRTLAGGGQDGLIHLWDPQTGESRSVFRSHHDAVRALAFHPATEHLLSGGRDQKVLRWPVAGSSLPPLTQQAHQEETLFVAFSPTGDWLASGGLDGGVALWTSAVARSPNAPLPRPGQTPNDSRGTTKAVSGQVNWNQGFQQERVWQGHFAGANCGVFLNQGKLLATAGGTPDNTVKIWEVASGKPLATLVGHAEGIRSLAVSADGKALYSASNDKTVKCWDLQTFQEKATYRGHTAGARCLALSGDGKTLVSGSGVDGGRMVGELMLWDTETGTLRQTVPDVKQTIWAVAFSPDGNLLLSGMVPGVIRVWDARTLAPRTKFQARGVRSLAFSPDGKVLAVGFAQFGGQDPNAKALRLWDTATWDPLVSPPGLPKQVFCAAYSPDGRTLAMSSRDETITLLPVGPRGKSSAGSGANRESPPIGPGANRESPPAGPDANSKSPLAGPGASRKSPPAGPGSNSKFPPVGSAAKSEPPSALGQWTWIVLGGFILTAFTLTGVIVWLCIRGGIKRQTAMKAATKQEKIPARFPFACSGCGQTLKAKAELAGKTVKCPKCGSAVKVPAIAAGDAACSDS